MPGNTLLRYGLADVRGGDWVEFGTGYDKHVAFANQLRNFVDVMRGEAEPVVSVEDAMESGRAIEAAYRSARVGRWVPLSINTPLVFLDSSSGTSFISPWRE